MSSFRSGYVAIVGWPNVGKSSLMNALLGSKLSIVSPRPQTTRVRVRGILSLDGAQMIFVDTPGWLQPKDGFQSFMKRSILQSLYDDADVLLWVLDPRPLDEEQAAFAEMLGRVKKPVLVAVNKVDTVKERPILASLTERLPALCGKEVPCFYVSAVTQEGVNELRQRLLTTLPEGPAYFPVDQITDRWERFFVGELVREALFKLYRQEVPHAAAVVVEEFKERESSKDLIRATIFVETDGQKKIVVGHGGQAIKKLGQAARTEMEKLLGRGVFLELTVKVRRDWRKDPAFIRQLENDF